MATAVNIEAVLLEEGIRQKRAAAPITHLEYAVAALERGGLVNGSVDPKLVQAIVAVLNLAADDENRACELLAQDAADRYHTPTAEDQRFVLGCGIAARIRQRRVKWPDEGATR
jgi:hypothetical protein